MTLDDEHYPTHNEFRSDTFTVPTKLMKDALAHALCDGSLTMGDSVYQEDATTLALERQMCDMTGKEAALFCVSGTLSNQIGIRASLLQPPYLVLTDHRAHVFMHEANGLAALSQAMVHPVVPQNGNYLTVEDIVENYTPDDGDIHALPTKVISLENTLHGIITPIDEIRRISQFAKENNIWLHMDGARLFNAAVETGVLVEEYCSYCDSVSLCLSKSVGAPIGSILVGLRQFVAKANHFKKQCGGGIRQSAMMAHMAIAALNENMAKIRQSHAYAKEVGEFCRANDIALELPVDTNFVFIDLARNKMSDERLVAIGEKHGVKLMGKRIAFHFQLDRESVDRLKDALLECKRESERTPYVGKKSRAMYNVDVVKRLAALNLP